MVGGFHYLFHISWILMAIVQGGISGTREGLISLVFTLAFLRYQSVLWHQEFARTHSAY